MLNALSAFERYAFISFGLLTIIFLLRSISLFKNKTRPGFLWSYSPYGNLMAATGASMCTTFAVLKYLEVDYHSVLAFYLIFGGIILLIAGTSDDFRKKEAYKKPWLANVRSKSYPQ